MIWSEACICHYRRVVLVLVLNALHDFDSGVNESDWAVGKSFRCFRLPFADNEGLSRDHVLLCETWETQRILVPDLDSSWPINRTWEVKEAGNASSFPVGFWGGKFFQSGRLVAKDLLNNLDIHVSFVYRSSIRYVDNTETAIVFQSITQFRSGRPAMLRYRSPHVRSNKPSAPYEWL